VNDVITNVVQAYERGYARGYRDTRKTWMVALEVLAGQWEEDEGTRPAARGLRDLIAMMESRDAVPQVVGDQEPKEDPHE
jgi:hypothetical protein